MVSVAILIVLHYINRHLWRVLSLNHFNCKTVVPNVSRWNCTSKLLVTNCVTHASTGKSIFGGRVRGISETRTHLLWSFCQYTITVIVMNIYKSQTRQIPLLQILHKFACKLLSSMNLFQFIYLYNSIFCLHTQWLVTLVIPCIYHRLQDCYKEASEAGISSPVGGSQHIFQFSWYCLFCGVLGCWSMILWKVMA